MKSSTGRWVSGDDFFNRDPELGRLKRLVQDRNHVLLTGQRRMGKTSVVRELGRQLETEGWIFLFTDIEGATCPEDVVADIARPRTQFALSRRVSPPRWDAGSVARSRRSAHSIFASKSAPGWTPEAGGVMGSNCSATAQLRTSPVLLAIDELPIFLKRMLSHDDDEQRVEEFLSWLRGVLQDLGDGSPVLVVSGSIGLEPLVRRLGIPDRINHLYPFPLGPWDQDTSVRCFERLAESQGLPVEDGVAHAVYEALGIGIPHHVQSFFARLCDFTAMQRRDRVTVEDVGEVYRTGLLGPSGQNDLAHYETRLKKGLEEGNYTIAMQILAEAATQEAFVPAARRCLEQLYAAVMDDAPGRIADTLEVLEHDGYLKASDDGHRFPSRLLKDWWAARFRDHHIPLENRCADNESREQVR